MDSPVASSMATAAIPSSASAARSSRWLSQFPSSVGAVALLRRSPRFPDDHSLGVLTTP